MLVIRLHEAIVAAGVAIAGVSIGTPGVKATYLVTPTNLQAAAQATINAFDDSQAADTAYEAQQAAKTIGRSSIVRKTADQAFSTVNFADCADLSFPLAPNSHYKFRFAGAYTAAASTTGLQISVNGPASPSFIRFVGSIYTAANAVLGGAGGAYDVAIPATASGAATALPFDIEGTISTGAASGALVLRVRSEVAASAVNILRGSFGELAAAS